MGNLMNEIMTMDLPAIGGGIGAGVIKNLSKKVTKNEKLQAAAPLVVGVVLRRMKSPAAKYAGLGMIACAGRDLAGSFIPALKGIEDMELGDLFDNVLNGDFNVSDNVLNDDLGRTPDYDLSDDLSDDLVGDNVLSGEDYM